MSNSRRSKNRILLTTVPMPCISFVNQIPGRKINPHEIKTVKDCVNIANNESFLGGRSQPAIGLHFLKANIPAADMLEFPQWEEYEAALKQGYDIVGISFYTTNFFDAVKMAEMAREAGVKEVWAGNYGALTPGASDYFNRIFTGHAEAEMKMAVMNEELDYVRHPVITTPFSAILGQGERAGYLFTKRGCIFKCQFCCSPVFSPKTDTINTEEIERVLDQYRDMGITYINIGDETFLQDPKHAGKIMELLHKKEMKWFCTTRADLLSGHVKQLKEKGFDSVYMGIESINNTNLIQQKKGQPVETIIEVLDELKQNGISTSGTYILGLMNDTVSSIKEDLELLNTLPINILIFIIFTPYPGLPVYRQWKEDGLIINNDWRDFDGLHMVFKHPRITPAEAQGVFEYAICNIYSPYNYNKRRILNQLNRIRNNTGDF